VAFRNGALLEAFQRFALTAPANEVTRARKRRFNRAAMAVDEDKRYDERRRGLLLALGFELPGPPPFSSMNVKRYSFANGCLIYFFALRHDHQ
jgi:hypothetical protein